MLRIDGCCSDEIGKDEGVRDLFGGVVLSKEKRWAERLNSLPEEKQSEISKKYYGGSMPWKGGNDKHV